MKCEGCGSEIAGDKPQVVTMWDMTDLGQGLVMQIGFVHYGKNSTYMCQKCQETMAAVLPEITQEDLNGAST